MADLGRWITKKSAAPFYARRTFQIEKEVRRATAKVCGLGQFVFSMNGKKVGDHELDPGWTNYRKLIQYVTFDVTSKLRQGENVLGVEVGNGWFLKTDEHYTFSFPAFMPPNPNPYRPFGKWLMLALELEIWYRDGSREVLRADEEFRVKEHPVVMSNVYGSETLDARLEQKGWNEPGFEDASWERASFVPEEEEPAGRLIEQFQLAVKVIRTYEGRLLSVIPGSGAALEREIYDFSQNMSGILELELRGKRGDEVRIYPAEKLKDDGDVDQVAKNWVTVDSCVTCIIGEEGVWETFRMKFAYFAGRYVAVERIPAEGRAAGAESGSWDVLQADCRAADSAPECASRLSLRNLRAHAITSAWETSGHFTCDDVRYLQIYSLVEKAVEANMVSVHTDCPTIERFAWQEPNHLMAPSIFYMKNGRKLWEKFLLDMRTEQHTEKDAFLDLEGNLFYPGEGLIPSQCPCYIPNVLPVPGMGSFYDIIAWGSACILGTWWHYQFYGDVQIIRDNYDAGMRYLNHLKTKLTPDGFISHGLGDWGNLEQNLLRENIETAFLYADTITLQKFASLLGNAEDARELEAFANQVKENYNSKLLAKNPETGLWGYRAWDHPETFLTTQAGQALPLYWGMVPREKETDVVKTFRMTLEEKGAFVAGEIGLPYVIQTAKTYGMNDLIARFILRETHPSYYAFVLDGETTLGEYWERNPRSHCHDMMGHIIEWYYNGIAGITPLEPGFAKVGIKPFLPETMTEFSCSYQSAQGPISVHVKEAGDTLFLDVELPEQVPCVIDTEFLKLRKGKIKMTQKKTFTNTRNPILPVKYHVPDGEGHVMPDGKLYIYGSYDDREDVYCSESYYVISTPDLEHWTIHEEALNGNAVPWFGDPDAPKYPGIDWSRPTPFIRKMLEDAKNKGDDLKAAFEQEEQEKPALLFAPDCIEKDGTYYLYFCMADDSEGVAVSDRPEGPFGNPVQLPCGGIDPAVFVDEDGQAYYYWGQLFSHGVKLNPDMVSFDAEGIVDDLVTEETHFFHEGSSMRKIGDTYYYVYADMERGKPTALGYATGKTPLGPFTYRGILIDNDGCDPESWNNHGSIECVNGQWYVFYHRSSRGGKLHRRLCMEPITILPDGTIPEVKMTSQGAGEPFAPGERIFGYQACGVTGTACIDLSEHTPEHPEKLTKISAGDSAVFRYVKSGSDWKEAELICSGSGRVRVLMDGEEAGVLDIAGKKDALALCKTPLHMPAGQYEVMLVFEWAEELEIMELTLR
ncbi:MAG: family 78 glycoside hydrolase catalytic domain [Eubacteriales bacterium]|nr:family 78 glycoside hydrolase catalytic domain [Eubacteriales bacterium]